MIHDYTNVRNSYFRLFVYFSIYRQYDLWYYILINWMGIEIPFNIAVRGDVRLRRKAIEKAKYNTSTEMTENV